LAGFVVFPAVFHFGLDMASGPGLIFQTLPVAFSQMPGGSVFAVLFFVMLAVAGVTSMVGLLESVTSWTKERLQYVAAAQHDFGGGFSDPAERDLGAEL
jgi:NSS family neurotransmitter:Na+ symporter